MSVVMGRTVPSQKAKLMLIPRRAELAKAHRHGCGKPGSGMFLETRIVGH